MSLTVLYSFTSGTWVPISYVLMICLVLSPFFSLPSYSDTSYKFRDSTRLFQSIVDFFSSILLPWALKIPDLHPLLFHPPLLDHLRIPPLLLERLRTPPPLDPQGKISLMERLQPLKDQMVHPIPLLQRLLTPPLALKTSLATLSSSTSYRNGNQGLFPSVKSSSMVPTSSNNMRASSPQINLASSPTLLTRLTKERHVPFTSKQKKLSKVSKLPLIKRLGMDDQTKTMSMILTLRKPENVVVTLSPMALSLKERVGASERKISCGLNLPTNLPKRSLPLECVKPIGSSGQPEKILGLSCSGPSKLQELPPIFPTQNGQTFCTDEQLISTLSTQISTYRSLSERMWNMWEESRSLLQPSTSPNPLKWPLTGSLPGEEQPKWLWLSSPTDSKRWRTTQNILKDFSVQPSPALWRPRPF